MQVTAAVLPPWVSSLIPLLLFVGIFWVLRKGGGN